MMRALDRATFDDNRGSFASAFVNELSVANKNVMIKLFDGEEEIQLDDLRIGFTFDAEHDVFVSWECEEVC